MTVSELHGAQIEGGCIGLSREAGHRIETQTSSVYVHMLKISFALSPVVQLTTVILLCEAASSYPKYSGSNQAESGYRKR